MNASRLLSLLLFVVGAALATGWPLLFNLIYLLVGLLVLSWGWSRLGLVWLDFHRQVRSDRLQVGQMSVQGVGMLSVVRSKAAWIEANFKEKDVGKMVPGQRAEITVDPYPGVKFPAHVQSIGAGTGSEFSLLPAQNANGNWVKVTQRVPIRIAFNEPPSKPMIAGLSVTAKVYFDNK